ncbi:MAG: transcription-repair coupling factor [Nitrospirota bacterium]
MSTIYDHLKTHTEDVFRRLEESGVKRIYNLSPPHFALLLAFTRGSFIVIEDSDERARVLHNDLLFFARTLSEAAPYIGYVPPPSGPESIGERAKVLFDGISQRRAGVITSPEAFRTGFSLPALEKSLLHLRKGMVIERERLQEILISLGYRKVSVVIERGEFSRREWLFDIYPVTEGMPVRIEFFGDEIDLIRAFDIETQRSAQDIDGMRIFPAVEPEPQSTIVDELSYLWDIRLFLTDSAGNALYGKDTEPEMENGLPDRERAVFISHLPFLGEGIDSGEQTIKGMGILPGERKGFDDIPSALTGAGARVAVVLPSEAQAERLKEILFEHGVVAPLIRDRDVRSYGGAVCTVIGNLSSGMYIDHLLLLTDREIFGERPAYRSLKKSKASKILFTIDDLKPGDFVVHKDHGIGKFVGLQRQRTDSYQEDLITIEYAQGDRIYTPFHSIDKLQKYSAGEGHVPVIDKLGSKKWLRTKQRVREKVREMAEKLLKLYAERSVVRGFTFSEDTPMHHEFDDFFPYEETPDQLKSIEEIKQHMHSERPMDMLLCGDVGYGKTEVAVRAAFRAVYDGKQVVVLVPTTLLAEQHYRTFKTRFSGFPVTIDYLSRFRDKSEINKSLEALAKGETDIIIGTHMLLGKRVQLHDLGLLIIDEEHRFGVAQKERLRELRKGVDTLTLTATPIPRTLHMSLSGIREISTIETPPEERLAVRSIVTAFNDKTIKEAIERELKRDGQVFFVHNRIHDIEKVADYIKKLVPEAKIAVAHGQMQELGLEKIMLGFLNRTTNVLVCTAIIGSGIDIPTANTIIIDRADTFGLADIYQLRGRVGRGALQAYAYFLIPGEDIITEDAKKRLQAIQEMSYLGAGFRLAMKDLEIRGAGNLLGPEQSGYIRGVGFDLYMEMLEKAVAELKGEELREEIEPQIRLRLSAFIPEEYISDITLRLSIYKRISSAKTMEALTALKDELRDRFGALPEEVENLIHVMRVKLLTKRLFIIKVTDIDGRYRFFFLAGSDNRFGIPPDFFDRLITTLFSLSSDAGNRRNGTRIRFLPDGFELDIRDLGQREAVAQVESTLSFLAERLHYSRPLSAVSDQQSEGERLKS